MPNIYGKEYIAFPLLPLWGSVKKDYSIGGSIPGSPLIIENSVYPDMDSTDILRMPQASGQPALKRNQQ